MIITWLLICVVGISFYPVEARITAEICEVKPKERHCKIESVVKDKWPHQERWVWDWDQRKCFIMYWANHCPAPMPDTNNFASEAECTRECSGWA